MIVVRAAGNFFLNFHNIFPQNLHKCVEDSHKSVEARTPDFHKMWKEDLISTAVKWQPKGKMCSLASCPSFTTLERRAANIVEAVTDTYDCLWSELTKFSFASMFCTKISKVVKNRLFW